MGERIVSKSHCGLGRGHRRLGRRDAVLGLLDGFGPRPQHQHLELGLRLLLLDARLLQREFRVEHLLLGNLVSLEQWLQSLDRPLPPSSLRLSRLRWPVDRVAALPDGATPSAIPRRIAIRRGPPSSCEGCFRHPRVKLHDRLSFLHRVAWPSEDADHLPLDRRRQRRACSTRLRSRPSHR